MSNRARIACHYVRTKYGLKFRSRQELTAWQEKKVQKFLRTVLPRSLFYREAFVGQDISAWRDLPIITKTQMIEHFDRLNTAGISGREAFDLAIKAERSRDFRPMIRKITVGLSSGTSGNRGIFLVSNKERRLWAGAVLAKILPGSILKKHAIAFFLRANSNLYQMAGQHRIRFEFFDLLAGLDQHVERLNKYLPSILVAPPSMLRLLAAAKESGRLNIHPQRIVSVAEVLDPLDEAYISGQFRQTVHQVYQATEGFLAATCRYGTLHLNEDLLVVQKEYLDKGQGRFVPVITDFSRTTQPIIRYRLNDILTEKAGACPCGSVFTAIEKIEGRCDDIFRLPSRDGGAEVSVFPDFVARAVIYSDESIAEYKVTQRSREEIEVFFRLKNNEDNNRRRVRGIIQGALSELFVRSNAAVPRISFIDQLENIPGKKFKRVERLVANA